MSANDLIRSESELCKIADALSEDARRSNTLVVSRHLNVAGEYVYFKDGKNLHSDFKVSSLNKELPEGIYTSTTEGDISADNAHLIQVARDLEPQRFRFRHKGVPLPTSHDVFFENMPSNIDCFDDELREFTKDHPNTYTQRQFYVVQQVIVNSEGGVAIQSVPFFEIRYGHGFEPIPTNRSITAVCNTDADVAKMQSLIKFLPDPTPDKRIKNAKSFSQAFHQLTAVSGLKYGSLEEAGIELAGLYDVVVLSGVPAHEVFGHQFEEPVRFIEFGESGTFKLGQSIENKDIIIRDDPHMTLSGLRVRGFTHFDSYGRPRQTREHIKNGRVVGFLGSEYADLENLAGFMNIRNDVFVGNASQYIDSVFPHPRMSCTVLTGKAEEVDLEGKILLVSHEGHTDSSDKTYNVSAKECYVVKNGEPKRVVPLKVTGGINQALANIVLINDLSYNTGFCSKGDPINYPSGRAQVPVSQFANSQIWQGQQVYSLPISDRHLRILQNEK